MTLFHITSNHNTEAILRTGFRDTTGYYFTDQDWTGFATRFTNHVWLYSDPSERANYPEENILLAMEIPEAIINKFELVEAENSVRKFLVPAMLLNSYELAVVANDC